MQFRFFFSIDFDINFGIFLQTADYSNYNNSINNPYKLDLGNYSEIFSKTDLNENIHTDKIFVI